MYELNRKKIHIPKLNNFDTQIDWNLCDWRTIAKESKLFMKYIYSIKNFLRMIFAYDLALLKASQGAY